MTRFAPAVFDLGAPTFELRLEPGDLPKAPDSKKGFHREEVTIPSAILEYRQQNSSVVAALIT